MTPPARLRTEIAHVLFIDIVSYSKLSMEEQARQIEQLQALVSKSPEFQSAHQQSEIVVLPTGDGMALVFFRDPVSPAQCAIEVSRSIRDEGGPRVRMGVNSGPVSRVTDLSGKENVSGSGINIAQRVMDCGDVGHVLLSRTNAEVLLAFEGWEHRLKDLGDFKVKHGEVIRLFNYFDGEIGNSNFPEKGKPQLPTMAEDEDEEILPPMILPPKPEATRSPMRSATAYTISDRNAVTLPELADAMMSNEQVGIEDLFANDILLNWIGKLDTNVARLVRKDREAWRDMPSIALYRSVMRCDPSRPYTMPDGSLVYSIREWCQYAANSNKSESDLLEELASDEELYRLQAWVELHEDGSSALSMRVAQIRISPEQVRLEELLYLFDEHLPYPINTSALEQLRVVPERREGAKSPSEVVRLTYGSATEWEHGIPARYARSEERWRQGYLSAWLRQRGRGEIGARCEKAQRDAVSGKISGFETALRILDESLAPIEIIVEAREAMEGLVLRFGEVSSFDLHFRAVGPGIPFGHLVMENAHPGVKLQTRLITSREGTIELLFDSRVDMAPGIPMNVSLKLVSAVTAMNPSPIQILYTVESPSFETMRPILIGAILGLLLFGGGRLLADLFFVKGPVSFSDVQFSRLWEFAHKGDWHAGGYLFGGLIVLVCAIIFIRWALVVVRKKD